MDSGAKDIEVFFFVGEYCIGFIDVLFLAFKIQVWFLQLFNSCYSYFYESLVSLLVQVGDSHLYD